MDEWNYNNKKRKIESTKIEKNNESKKTKYLNCTNNNDDNVKLEGNHIYFYSNVNTKSVLKLNMIIKKLNKTLLESSLKYNTTPPDIYLHINSYGGSIFSAFSTIDTIRNSKIKITTIVEGCAASAATLISIVGHKRQIMPHAYMLIHQLSSFIWGKMSEIEDEYKNLKKLMSMIKRIYNEYTNVKLTGKKSLESCLKHDIWWDAKECLKYGLVDNIINNE